VVFHSPETCENYSRSCFFSPLWTPCCNSQSFLAWIFERPHFHSPRLCRVKRVLRDATNFRRAYPPPLPPLPFGIFPSRPLQTLNSPPLLCNCGRSPRLRERVFFFFANFFTALFLDVKHELVSFLVLGVYMFNLFSLPTPFGRRGLFGLFSCVPHGLLGGGTVPFRGLCKRAHAPWFLVNFPLSPPLPRVSLPLMCMMTPVSIYLSSRAFESPRPDFLKIDSRFPALEPLPFRLSHPTGGVFLFVFLSPWFFPFFFFSLLSCSSILVAPGSGAVDQSFFLVGSVEAGAFPTL